MSKRIRLMKMLCFYRLPLIEAILLESQRFLHVVPVAGPRRVLKDTTLGGYHIPKVHKFCSMGCYL